MIETGGTLGLCLKSRKSRSLTSVSSHPALVASDQWHPFSHTFLEARAQGEHVKAHVQNDEPGHH